MHTRFDNYHIGRFKCDKTHESTSIYDLGFKLWAEVVFNQDKGLLCIMFQAVRASIKQTQSALRYKYVDEIIFSNVFIRKMYYITLPTCSTLPKNKQNISKNLIPNILVINKSRYLLCSYTSKLFWKLSRELCINAYLNRYCKSQRYLKGYARKVVTLIKLENSTYDGRTKVRLMSWKPQTTYKHKSPRGKENQYLIV